MGGDTSFSLLTICCNISAALISWTFFFTCVKADVFHGHLKLIQMRARIKMLPPSSAFHPHLCTPIPAFVLPQNFTRPHNNLDEELPWLKTNLTANKQTNKQNKSTPPKTLTDFQLTLFPTPAQHLTTRTRRTAQRQGREGRSLCFTTITHLQSQWALKKHITSSLG